jgi:hypothetical protein
VRGGARGGDDGIDTQVKALGLPPEIAARLRAEARGAAPEDVEVLPDNWPAVRLFCAMGTQWRRAGMSGTATGFDYGALPIVAGALGLGLDEDLLGRLQVMEGEALKLMAAKR